MSEPADPNAAQWPQPPSSGQQPYPSQPYPPQGYPPPYPQPPYPPAAGSATWPAMRPVGGQPPAKRRNTKVIVIAVVAAAVVVAGGVIAAVVATGNSAKPSATGSTKLVAPASVGSYQVVTGSQANRIESGMTGLASGVGGQLSSIFDRATIAVYSDRPDESPTLVLVVMTQAQAVAIGAADGGDQALARELASSGLTNNKRFESGSHGGDLRCGTAVFGAATESICAWSDSHTEGLLYSLNPPKPPPDVARTANQFRDKLN